MVTVEKLESMLAQLAFTLKYIVLFKIFGRFKILAKTKLPFEHEFRRKVVFFSYQDKKELINYIYVLAKYHIYKTKFSKSNLTIHVFLSF